MLTTSLLLKLLQIMQKPFYGSRLVYIDDALFVDTAFALAHTGNLFKSCKISRRSRTSSAVPRKSKSRNDVVESISNFNLHNFILFVHNLSFAEFGLNINVYSLGGTGRRSFALGTGLKRRSPRHY